MLNKLRYWPILGQHWGIAHSAGAPVGSQLGISEVYTNLGLNCLYLIIIVPIFSVGKIIYLVGNFGQWADLIYWVSKVIY